MAAILQKPKKRKRFSIYLNPQLYTEFRLVCKKMQKKRTNRVLEAFMLAAVKNPNLIKVIYRMLEYTPHF